MFPYQNPTILSKGLSLLKGIKFSTLLDNTGKTLGVINQAIPIIYQIKPIAQNAKTLFSIASSLSNNSNSSNNEEKINIKKEDTTNNSSSNNKPIFYL